MRSARRRGRSSRLTFAAACLLVAACGRDVGVHERPPFSRDPPGPGPLGGRIVTSNSGDDTLSIVPAASPGPVSALPIGFSPVELEGPHHVAVDPLGRFLYVNLSLSVKAGGSGPHGAHGTGTQPGWVLKIDARDGRTVASVQVDRSPGDNVLSADGRTLFVTHYDLIAWTKGAQAGDLRQGDSPLVAIDTERMAVARRVPLCPAAHGVRLSADGAALYASCAADSLAVVDLRDPAWPVRRVALPGLREGATCRRCPYGVAVAPDGVVWVSSTGASNDHGGVDVYDPRLGAFDPVRSWTFHGAAMFPAFIDAPGGGYRVVVPEQARGGGRLHLLAPGAPDVAPALLATIDLPLADCVAPHMLLAGGEGRRAPLVCEGDHTGPGTLAWVDLVEGRVLGSVPVGVFPDGLAIVPEAR